MHSLSEIDRKEILELARRAVVEAVSNGRLPQMVFSSSRLEENRGVFVTLNVRGKLHGCMGVVQGYERLGESIARCAANAALNDPRFRPMGPEDLETLELRFPCFHPWSKFSPTRLRLGSTVCLSSMGSAADFCCHGLRCSTISLEKIS